VLDARAALVGGLRLHLGWKGIWGRRWAFRRAYYDYFSVRSSSAPVGDYRLEAPSSHVLRPLYRLDAGLSYERSWNGVRVEAQAHLVNVLDRANAFDWSLRPTDAGLVRSVRALPGRRPVVSLTVGY